MMVTRSGETWTAEPTGSKRWQRIRLLSWPRRMRCSLEATQGSSSSTLPRMTSTGRASATTKLGGR